jgi:putative transposase
MEQIELPEDEVEYLNAFVKKGKKNARELTRAHVLLLINRQKTEMEIKDLLGISRATVSNIKYRYRKEGIQNSLTDKPRPGQPKKYSDRHEMEIIAQACIKPPDGRKRWSLTLLTEEMRKKQGFETINRESVRLILKKAKQNLG